MTRFSLLPVIRFVLFKKKNFNQFNRRENQKHVMWEDEKNG